MKLISECKDKGVFTAKQENHEKVRPLVATTPQICDKKQRMMPELSHEFVGVDGLSNFSCNNTTMRTSSTRPADCGLRRVSLRNLSTVNYQLSTKLPSLAPVTTFKGRCAGRLRHGTLFVSPSRLPPILGHFL